MKPSINLSLLLLVFPFVLFSQQPGDTIFVQAFDYKSTTRDTVIEFPDNNLTYEKIIMEYNMRCKDGLVSTTADRNKGCGEWDYSCNTYIVDSSKIENVPTTHPEYIISNLTGDVFEYTNQQTFDFYRFPISSKQVNNIISEEEFTPLFGDDTDYSTLQTDQHSGRSLNLYTAEELTAAGLTAGTINALKWHVVNEGGYAGFMEIALKQTTENVLSNQYVDLTGYTIVYDNIHQFVPGINTTYFHESFEWDGTSNIIVQTSFTNSTKDNAIAMIGTYDNDIKSLYANNNFAVDLNQQGRIDIINEALETTTNEFSVAFWTFGNEEVLPTNTTVLYGYDTNPNNRDLNIHLPWSNGSIFFDCGFDGGYDRINKMATASNYEGQWNHWAFTKNASTGSMRIYLNGTLWSSATDKNRLINLMHIIVGSDPNGNNNYKGLINELSVWNVELSTSEIQSTMHGSITEQHPQYDQLTAYYPMNEGAGQELVDAKSGELAQGENLFWTYARGHEITRGFNETTIRPNLIFVRGEYDLTIEETNIMDSIARFPNSVRKYYVQDNEGTLLHDEILIESTEYLYHAVPENIYHGETGELISSIPVELEGAIEIEELDYIRRFPFYNELLSFVTPYGIGIDFGLDGKSWFFDVSDFKPILKGKKRLNMALGGQWQEQMDISFMFIVGTPPREVIDFNQIWQGTNRSGSANINAINTDQRYAPLQVPVHSDATQFKLRSTITGHGAAGEFQQNGGTVFHYINIDGGYEENVWSINQECSENPIYPQGGTWVYDRQGWCPGEVSELTEVDVTEFLTPGEPILFDYGCTEPVNTNGDYRYHISHQLVSYSSPSFTLDAAITDVMAPSNKALYTRLNPICANPVIIIQNTGENTVTAIEITYWINDGTKETFLYEDNLDFLETAEVQLPTGNVFSSLLDENNVFHAEITSVNGQNDEYIHNNSYKSAFERVKVIPDQFIIEVRTNLNSNENRYTLFNDKEEIVLTNTLPASNNTYRDTFDLQGCFKIELSDQGQDGLSWWANPNQGTGYARIKDINGEIIHTFNPDFGAGFEFNFVTESFNRVETPSWANAIKLYPNPASDIVSVVGTTEGDQLTIYDVTGKYHRILSYTISEVQQLDVSQLNAGIYFVSIRRKADVYTERLIIVK